MARPIEIYTLIDPRDQSVRYVGKAVCSAKRLKSHLRDARRRVTPVYGWVLELLELGLFPQFKVVRYCELSNWPDAEKEVISKFRADGAPLLNVSPGGNEPFCPRSVLAENGRRNAAARDKRMWRLLRQMGQALKDGHVSDATKAKMRLRPDVFGQFASSL